MGDRKIQEVNEGFEMEDWMGEKMKGMKNMKNMMYA